MQRNLLQTHIRTDEMSKLLWRNLAKTLESGDFRVWSEFTDSLLALFVTITIVGNEIALLLLGSQLGIGISHCLLILDLGTLVAHTEQWGLQYINMTLFDKVREELQEERDDEQADVHSIDIGIRGHNHLVVAQ